VERTGAVNYEFQRCWGSIVGIASDEIGAACNNPGDVRSRKFNWITSKQKIISETLA